MISKEFPLEDQADLLSVLTGLRIFNDFVGPLAFNTLFSFSISESWPGGKMPGIIFYVASAVYLLSACMAMVTFRVFPPESTSGGQDPMRRDFTLLKEGETLEQSTSLFEDDTHAQLHGELEEAFQLDELGTSGGDGGRSPEFKLSLKHIA